MPPAIVKRAGAVHTSRNFTSASTFACRRHRRSSVVVVSAAAMFMLSLATRRTAVRAFAPSIKRVPFIRRSFSTALEAASTATVRQQQLVVHGPPNLDLAALKNSFKAQSKAKADANRPFRLVIVESPSKCQTIANILKEYTIENQLDYDYIVTSCMGHIRNLASKKIEKKQKIVGVDVEGGKYEPQYEMLPQKKDLMSDLANWCDRAQQIVLATDDDREGEAMAWHLLKMLHDDTGTSDPAKLPPVRVRFTEITPDAIKKSIENPNNSLNDNLVHAQETRRILDRLAGYTVSPLLWKKIAPGLSAGRVQSVGLALIVQRERERLLFKESQYWDIKASFFPISLKSSHKFGGILTSVDDKPIVSGTSDFEARQANVLVPSSSHKLHLLEDETMELVNAMTNGEIWSWKVASVKSTERKVKPQPPFITSTLQQEANRKLSLSVSKTMQMAQQLYENGFISYMRTDSKHLSSDAFNAIKFEISSKHGGKECFVQRDYAAGKVKKSSKKKGDNKPDPQAAHEAIRPAIQPGGGFVDPQNLPSQFSGAVREVYTLIYQRTVASQMPVQVSNQTSVHIEGSDGEKVVGFRTSGSIVLYPGFTSVYPRSGDNESQTLPALRAGQKIGCEIAEPLSHTTQPPARFNEASFIQELESLGVGRPSTYAGVVKTLRDRGYVGSPASGSSPRRSSGPANVAQRAAGGEEFAGAGNARGPLIPSLTAFVVCSFLEKHCSTYVDPTFTAKMEERLDMIANSEDSTGEDDRINYLHEFYGGDDGLAAKIEYISNEVAAEEARRARLPSLGWNASTEVFDGDNNDVGLFVGPWGPYIQRVDPDAEESDGEKPKSASLPSGMAADLSTISPETLSAILSTKESNGAVLGEYPKDGRVIHLKLGRYGAYLQLGKDGEEGTTTHGLPREIGSMKGINLESTANGEVDLGNLLGLSFEDAVKYVELPKTVGTIEGKPIIAAIGPYGPYLKFNSTYMSLKASEGSIIDIEEPQAIELVTEGIINQKGKLARGVLVEVGEVEGKKVTVKEGRFGIYINWKKVNAKMPAEYMDDPSKLPLEVARELIEAKAGAPSKKSKKGGKSDNLPPAPKRPQSAYLLFCAEKRPLISEGLSTLAETSKELGRLWSKTSEEDREPYVKLAGESKTEYEVKKAEWVEECSKITGNKGKAKKGVKGGDSKPKRAKSAYLFFCDFARPEASKQFNKLGDISKEIARRWAEISDEDRVEFDNLAAADKVRYQTELTGSVAADASDTAPEVKKGRAKKSKNSKNVKIVAPKKRGPSAYILFCKEHRAGIVDENGNKLPLGETTKRLAKMWNESDEVTKLRFSTEAERAKELAY